MAIVIDENLEPITLRNLESLFVGLKMKITPDNPNGTIPSDWQGSYELTAFQDETNIVANGIVSKSTDDLKFELRVGYDITEPLFGKYVISVRAFDDTTKFSQYIYENILNIT